MTFDLDDDRLPATRRGVRWMLGLVAVTGAVDALGPLVADPGLASRTVADLVLTAVALSLPWLMAAALLPYRPRLATAMVFAMALVTLPRQVWQLWLLSSDLAAEGAGWFPEVVPRSVIVLLVLVTLWVAYLARPRAHWSGQATPLTRRALVPTVMALAWTLGPITDPVPSNGVEIGTLLPLYLGNPLVDSEPWAFLLVHALPVLIVATIAVGKHRRVAGAGMMVYGVAMFLLVLAEFVRARVLFDATLLPLGGVAFLGLFSLVVIGHQWSTEGARFADPGRVPDLPGHPAD